MSEDEEYAGYGEARQRRMKVVAWGTIVSLILVAGGSTILTLLFA